MTFFDTAEVYGPFTNEELVGEALEPFKGQVVIATKFGWKHGEKGPYPSVGTDSRPEQIKWVADASLKRRRLDVIDLFYRHRPERKIVWKALPDGRCERLSLAYGNFGRPEIVSDWGWIKSPDDQPHRHNHFLQS